MHWDRRHLLAYGCVVATGLAAGFGVTPGGGARAATAEVEEGKASRSPASVVSLPDVSGQGFLSEGTRSTETATGVTFTELELGREADPIGVDLSGLRMPDVPVHEDANVGRFVRYFAQTAPGRTTFRGWLKRSGRYRSAVMTALRDRMLPRDLMAVAYVESGFSPTAVSKAGATGLWQFMPDTARAYGLSVDGEYDERRSVVRASEAAARHLSDLYERFGTWELAMAAYNVGTQGLLDRVRETGSNDYWTLSKLRGGLPEETVLYVPKIVAVAIVMNNLEHFGFGDVSMDPAESSAELEVPGGVMLATVARAAGTSVNRLHELNPEWVGERVSERGGAVVHVPSSGLARARVMLPRLTEAGAAGGGMERRVSRSFDWGKDEVSETAVAGAERTPSEGASVAKGHGAAQSEGASVAKGHGAAPSEEVRTRSGEVRARSEEVVEGTRADGEPVILYRVGDHETLADITRALGGTADAIIEDNHLDPVAKLQRGMLLSVRVRPEMMSRLKKKRATTRLDEARQEGGEAGRSSRASSEPNESRSKTASSGPEPAAAAHRVQP